MSAVDLHSLRQQLEELLPTVGAEAALRRLGPAPAAATDRANIVIVGESDTGKTSLVNALLGRPGLMPVVPSSAYVAIGGTATAEAHAYYADGHASEGDLSLVSEVHTAVPDDRPERVEIGLDDPRLARLTLFDTPGVGGIDGGATELTLKALQSATALVFLVSAESKISIAERRFLADAAARVDQIVFVLSKIDVHPDWEAVLAENIETIRGDLTRFSRGRFDDMVFVPFSARLAQLAAAHQDADLADASGLDALWNRLIEISELHERLVEVNAMRAVASTIEEAETILAERQRLLANPPDDRQFAELSLQIASLTAANALWRTNLSKEIAAARDEVSTLQRRRVSQMRSDYDMKLHGKVKPDAIPEIEAQVVADLCAMQETADADLRTHITEVARRLLTDIPGGEVAAEDLTDHLPKPAETPSEFLRERPPPPVDPTELMMGASAMYIGSNMARAVLAGVVGAVGLTSATVGTAVTVATLPLGMLWWRVQRNLKHRAMDVASLRAWIVESIHTANAEIAADVDRGFRRGFDALHDAVSESVTEALRAATEARNDLDRAREQAAMDLEKVNHLKNQLGPIQVALGEHRGALLAVRQA